MSEMREMMSAQKRTAGKMRQKGMVMTDTPKYTTAATDVKLIDILHAEQNTLKARITALESALGVFAEKFDDIHNHAENSFGYKSSEAIIKNIIELSAEALSQPAMAQAAEKWRLMEAVVGAAILVNNSIDAANTEGLQSVLADAPVDGDRLLDLVTRRILYHAGDLAQAILALDACEKEGGKR